MGGFQHFINILDHSGEELLQILERSAWLKQRRADGIPDMLLTGRVLAMFFEKPSMRTRVSLEAAMAGMGGTAICLDSNEGPGKRLGEREPLEDIARVTSRYADLISIRTFAHEKVETLAAHSTIPVINALSDYSHPTQAMADVLTMRECFGDLKGKTLTFVGDGNNVSRSLAAVCAKLGMRFILAGPEGYTFTEEFLEKLNAVCPGYEVVMTQDAQSAVKEADAVYTDVWASMGQEDEAAKRRDAFMPYQINQKLMQDAPDHCIVLHCLPAHRGEEITHGVIESDASRVFDQAENRMHIYRGLFAELLSL